MKMKTYIYLVLLMVCVGCVFATYEDEGKSTNHVHRLNSIEQCFVRHFRKTKALGLSFVFNIYNTK